MALADARAINPGLAVAEADPAGDAAALARVAHWCGRWSPWTVPVPPDGVALDVTGCAHLQGGEDELLAEAVERLQKLGIAASAAIAQSAGAAWALARFGTARTVAVPPGETRAALAGLPVAALRLAPEMVEALTRLGLRHVGDLYPMPRPALVLRFGAGLALRLDQALGARAEPLSPVPPPPTRFARQRFAEPIATPDDIRAATSLLIEALCRRLAEDGAGARRLALTLYRVDGSACVIELGTARPSREPRHLLRLFDERLGAVDPGLGIEDMMLAASLAEPQGPAQLALVARGATEGDALPALIDRLAARLGRRCGAPAAPRRKPLARARGAPRAAARSGSERTPSGPPAPGALSSGARAGRGGGAGARRSAAPLPLAQDHASRAPRRRARAHRRRMVALGRRHPSERAARLLPRRGRGRPPLLALPRRALSRRPAGALVSARRVRVSPYAELEVTSNFSFLRGASHPEELVEEAKELGLGAIAIADRNSLAGVVRAFRAARELGVRLVVGCRLVLDGRHEPSCAFRPIAPPMAASAAS